MRRQSLRTIRNKPARALKGRLRERGAALIIALALVLLLVALTAATQMQVVVQLKGQKGQRDYDRALEMAEAGANAYLNYLAQGNHSNLTPWDVAPPPTVSSVPTTAEVRTAILNGRANSTGVGLGSGTNYITISGTLNTYANTMGLVPYPANGNITVGNNPANPSANSQFGYFVVLTSLSVSAVNMVSYGYSNGIVRRVQVGGRSSDPFDWAALWGMQPSNAWSLTGNLRVVGAFGGEGVMSFDSNARFYDGSGYASGPNASWNPSPLPVSQQFTSSPGVPTGHIGTGTLAAPFIRTIGRSLAFLPADQEANLASGTTQKIEYFRTHNNNSTGLRYLVQNKSTNAIREIAGSYTVLAPGSYVLDSGTNHYGWKVATSDLVAYDPTFNSSTEQFYGIRMYPGVYFFEQINMSNSAIMNVRSYNDYDRTSSAMTGDTTYVGIRPSNDTSLTNPNSGLDDGTVNGLRNTRIYIGHASSKADGSADNPSAFTNGCTMEYWRYPSRFRIYISSLTTSANNRQVTVGGTSAVGLPAAFNCNMLVYNQETGVNSGNAYGYISFGGSAAYLRGSLIAWNVTGSGGPTVEKAAAEGTGGGGTGSTDRLAFTATSWKELP